MSKRSELADVIRHGCDRDGTDYKRGYVMIYQHVSEVAGRDVLNTARVMGKRPIEIIEAWGMIDEAIQHAREIFATPEERQRSITFDLRADLNRARGQKVELEQGRLF